MVSFGILGDSVTSSNIKSLPYVLRLKSLVLHFLIINSASSFIYLFICLQTIDSTAPPTVLASQQFMRLEGEIHLDQIQRSK